MEISWGTFKTRSNSAARKLSLDKGEQVRASFLDKSPRMVFVHTFEKVITGPDGHPVEIKDEWPDGSPRTKVKTDYAGKLRCLGKEDVVDASGADPENCPACRAHIRNSNAVRAPQRRFLGHVLKYNTKPGSFAITKPFSASLIIWDLTEGRFNQLKSLYDEHGDLSKKDLLLGPCENKQMQKFDIQIGSGDAEWTKNSDYVSELLREERIDDVEAVAGKLPTEFEMNEKVNEIVRAYNHAFGISSGSSSYESLLNNEEEAEDKGADAISSLSNLSEEDASEDEGVEEETEVTDATGSLDDILKSLGAS